MLIKNLIEYINKSSLNIKKKIEKLKLNKIEKILIEEIRNNISLDIDNLKELGLTKRPIHCTDVKRNTLYIKENDTWDKEGSQESLKRGLRQMTSKSHKSLYEFKAANSEEYEDIESEFSNKCIEIQRNIMPGYSSEKNIDKIIHNISANSVVDKL